MMPTRDGVPFSCQFARRLQSHLGLFCYLIPDVTCRHCVAIRCIAI